MVICFALSVFVKACLVGWLIFFPFFLFSLFSLFLILFSVWRWALGKDNWNFEDRLGA